MHGHEEEFQSCYSARDVELLEKERDDAVRQASELLDQVKAMDEAARLLLRVISVHDSHADAEPTSPTEGSEDELREDESSCRSLSAEFDVGMTFDTLQKQWKLEQTGFPSLFNACKMLQQNRDLMAQEADYALDAMRLAQNQAAETERKLMKTKKALRAVWKENLRLKKENTKHKETIVEIGHDSNEQLDQAYAILAHEKALSPPRSRRFESPDISSIPFPPLSPSPSMESGSSCCSSPSRRNDENEAPELTTPPRIVKRIATVQFEDETPGVGDLISRWMNKPDQQRNAYKIKFPNSKEIGLKLHSMQVDATGLRRRQPNAFIVWGFRDVDTCCSTDRPTVGARLVAVDGKSCEFGQWKTLKELCRHVRSKSGPIMLTFRNDPVTKDQIDHLNRALSPQRLQTEGQKNENTSTTASMMKTPEKRRPLGVLRNRTT